MSRAKKQKGSVFCGPFVVSTVRAPKPCSHSVKVAGVPLFYWKTLSSPCVDALGPDLASMAPCGNMSLSPLKVVSFSNVAKEKALAKKFFLGIPVEVLEQRPYGPCAFFANLRGYTCFYSMASVYLRWLDKCAKSFGVSWPVYLCLSCLGNVSYYSERYNQLRCQLGMKVVDWLENLGGGGVCGVSSDLFESVWTGRTFEENGVLYRRPPGFMFLLPVLKPNVNDEYERLFSALWDTFGDLCGRIPFHRVQGCFDDVAPRVDTFVDLVGNRLFGPALYLYVFDYNFCSRYSKHHLLDQYYFSLTRCSPAHLVEFIDYLFTNTPAYFFHTVYGLDHLLRWLLYSVRNCSPKRYEAFVGLQRVVGDNGECYPSSYMRLFSPATTDKQFIFSLRYNQDTMEQFQRCAAELSHLGNVWSLFYLCSITNELYRYEKVVHSLFSDPQVLRGCWVSLWLDVLGMPYYGFMTETLRWCSRLGVFPLGGGLGEGVCDPVLESLWWTSSLSPWLYRVRSFIEEDKRHTVDNFGGRFFTKFKDLLGQYSGLIGVWESWFSK